MVRTSQAQVRPCPQIGLPVEAPPPLPRVSMGNEGQCWGDLDLKGQCDQSRRHLATIDPEPYLPRNDKKNQEVLDQGKGCVFKRYPNK